MVDAEGEPLPEELAARCEGLRRAFDEDEVSPPRANMFSDPSRYLEQVLPIEIERLRHREPDPLPGLDLLVLSCGTSPQPLLLSVAYVRPARVLIVGSDTHTGRDAVERLEDLFARGRPRHFDHRKLAPLFVSPSEPEMAYQSIVTELRSTDSFDPDRTAVDITGGKKTMVAAAFLACSELGLRSLYLDGDYDLVRHLPRPATARLRLLRDPVEAFGLRELVRARTLVSGSRFDVASEILRYVAAARRVLDPPAADLLEKSADRAMALGLWKEGRYVDAREQLRCAGLEVPSSLQVVGDAWEREIDGSRLRTFVKHKRGEALIAFVADRLCWASVLARTDPRDAFLRAYSALEVLIDGLLLWLTASKRWTLNTAIQVDLTEWSKLVHGGVRPKELTAVVKSGEAKGNIASVERFDGLGEVCVPLLEHPNDLTDHRNQLVHRVEEVRPDLLEQLLTGARPTSWGILRAVADAMGLSVENGVVEAQIESLLNCLDDHRSGPPPP